MYGGSSYGSVPFGSDIVPTGVPIIPEVTHTTTELVFVIEIDLIRPVMATVDEDDGGSPDIGSPADDGSPVESSPVE